METDDTAEVTAAIRSGTVNLAAVTDAIRAVIESSDAVLLWEIDCSKIPSLVANGCDVTFGPDDLTLGEQVAVMDDVKVGWESFNPQKNQRHAAAVLTAVLASRTDLPADVARNVVEGVTTGQFDAAYRIVEKRPADPT